MIGAYFPCFNRIDAANEVLFSYRRHYPDTTVVMVNDRGDDNHRALAHRYKCQYYYQATNVGYPGGNPEHYQITEWIHRFLTHICYIKEEWFFLLEDDVFTLGVTDHTKLKYDINGVNPRNILPAPSGAFLRERLKQNVPYYIYGAMGGAIFRTSFFRKMAQNPGDVTAVINKFGLACPPSLTGQNWYYSDVILSYLAYWYEGTLGQYSEFAELWFSDLNVRLAKKAVGTLNQFKFLYGLEPHPNLIKLNHQAYTVVLPLTGNGASYSFFLKYALSRYVELLDRTHLHEFVVIVPTRYLSKCQQEMANIDLPLVWYTDEELGCTSMEGLKLAVAKKIQTEHYLLVQEDLALTSSLSYHDLFEGKCVRYWVEAYQSSTWDNAAKIIPSPPWTAPLAQDKQLMASMPQVFITRCVYQLTQTVKEWSEKVKQVKATQLYWLYLRSTFRDDYYVPSSSLFALDPEVNVLVSGLTPTQVQAKITSATTNPKHKFLLIESWCKYPLDWIVSTNDSSSQMSHALSKRLMIYANTAHLIQTLAPGTKSVPLPRDAELSSVLIYTNNGRVVPFRYHDETSAFEGYGDRHTGERYEIEIHKNGEVIEGQVLTLTPTSATVLCSDGVIIVPDYQSAKVKRPIHCLTPYLHLSYIPETPFTVSARLNKVTWNCVGRGLVDATSESGSTLYLQLAGVINNRTDRDFHAQISLVAGNPRSAPNIGLLRSVAETNNTEEYQAFNVGERCVGAQELIELENIKLATSRIFVHHTNTENIQFGLEVVTPVPLPAHTLDLYQLTNVRTIDHYLGSASVSAHAADDKFDILLGDSTSVTGKSTVTSVTDLDGTVTEQISGTIHNHGSVDTQVRIRHPLGARPLLDIIPSQDTTREEGYISWTLTLTPGVHELEITVLSKDNPIRT